MTRARSALLWASTPLFCGMLSGCTSPPPPDPTPVVYAWMQCQDCMKRERERVIALGDTAVPLLRDLLLNGPPQAHVLAVTAVLQDIQARAAPGAAPSPAAIAMEIDGFRSMYRTRASSALVGIRTPAARNALCRARATPNVPVAMRRMLDSGIANIGGPCP